MALTIISISGVDGSGKSTQVQLLSDYLESKGQKVHYFHAIQFSVGNSGRKEITTPGQAPAVTKSSWSKIQLRKIAYLIDLVRYERLCTRLEAEGYTHIVSDRYFCDTLVNIYFLCRNKRSHYFGHGILSLLYRLPSLAFYIDISPETIVARTRGVKQDSEQDFDYTREKLFLYQKFSELYHLIPVDGQRSPLEVHASIVREIREENSSRS